MYVVIETKCGVGLYPHYITHGPIRAHYIRITVLTTHGPIISALLFEPQACAGYSVCAPSRRTLMSGYHTGHFPLADTPWMLSPNPTTVAAWVRHEKLIGKRGLDGNYQMPEPPSEGFPTLQGYAAPATANSIPSISAVRPPCHSFPEELDMLRGVCDSL